MEVYPLSVQAIVEVTRANKIIKRGKNKNRQDDLKGELGR